MLFIVLLMGLFGILSFGALGIIDAIALNKQEDK